MGDKSGERGHGPTGESAEWVKPPVNLELVRDTTDIWRVRLDTPADLGELRGSLSEEERRRADRFRFRRDRRRFLIARLGLRSILARYLSMSPEEVGFRFGEHGKPAAVADAGLQFSLSHSEEMAVVAVSLDRSVGVDVERIRHLPDLEALARRCFSESEERSLSEVPVAERPELFFRIWIRKEACLKALGSGLTVSPTTVRVVDDCGKLASAVGLSGFPNEGTWHVFEFVPADQYRAAVALEGSAAPRALRLWEGSVGDELGPEPVVEGIRDP